MTPNPPEADTTSGQQQQDASLHQAAWPDMLSSLHVAYGDLTRTQLELERRMAEIDETRELFERVIESMSEALFLMDVAGRIIRVNRAAGALLECELATLVGKRFADVPATPWRLLERASNGVLTDIEVELRGQSGRVIPVSMSCVLVRDRQGKVTGVLAMARDITARLQAEAAQRELQKQLVQASRRAGMADVAANVLHNVGNVLNSVNISAGVVTSAMRQSPIGDVSRIAALLHEHAPALGDYLTSDTKGKQIPTYLVALGDHLTQERASVLKELSSLSSKIEHIRQIISMQQDFTRVGGLEASENLAELMDEALAINFASLERHHIEVVREYAEIPLIVLDRHPVLQILVNLISNSYLTKPIKPSELLDAILTVFDTSSPKHEPSAPVTRHSLRESRQRRHILLAEDNLVNQKLLIRLLENRGHTVVVAANGREALAALERERFDLLLMDVQMPEMDGIQTTTAIRHKERQTNMRLPIIAMTAHAMRGDRERCLQAGMDGYISKPVRADELLAVVEGILPVTAWQDIGESVDTQATAVFDRTAALSYVDGDLGLLQEMAEAFLADYPLRLAEIQEAITVGDSQALMRAAHSLKGGVGSFAAKPTYDAALRLEMMGRSGDLSQARDVYATLEAELSRLISFLARLGGSDGRMTTV